MPTAAVRPAPTKRTAVARIAPIASFDDARKKASKGRKASHYQMTAYGKTWDLKRPNQVLIGELESSESVGAMVDYLLAHVVEAQRSDFMLALKDDEGLDITDLVTLHELMAEVVYADLPTPPS